MNASVSKHYRTKQLLQSVQVIHYADAPSLFRVEVFQENTAILVSWESSAR